VTEDDGGHLEDGGLSSDQKTPGRKTVIALVLFGAVAVLAWQTMEPGKFRTLVFVILGGLALRVVLGFRRSNIDSETR
jgi:predicted membrane chloride channel (bestrophin family)